MDSTGDILLEVNQRGTSIQSRGLVMVLVASRCINQNKLRLHGSGRLEVQVTILCAYYGAHARSFYIFHFIYEIQIS